jgi:hypothetical protein
MAKTEMTNRLDRLTNAQLAEVYNLVSERKISKFSDHSTAVKRTELALEAAGMDFATHEGRVTVAPVEKKDEIRGDQRRITVLADANPKRAGSASHARFALYKSGMVVEDYVAACAKIGVKRAVAIRDIGWDLGMKFIQVEG